MALQILAVGDLHLGRTPSRLPEDLADRDTARRLGPHGAWERLVALAVDRGVDVVAMAGDVVEGTHDFFEAHAALDRGVSRLREAGVRCLAVVGNHDVNVLPRLADHVDGFELIGRDGRWESVELDAGGERATLWGWSFPDERVTTSPLAGARLDEGAGPRLGLLHCDRDQTASPYAPVTSRELADAGVDGWLLGHVHKPDLDALRPPAPAGYLGTVTGLDPGEPGPRGPWLVTVDGGRITDVAHWRIAPLRWERVEVDLTGLDVAAGALDRLREALDALGVRLDAEAEAGHPAEVVGLRVRLVGRTGLRAEVLDHLGSEHLDHLPVGAARGFVEHFEADTRPAADLDLLARGADPPGLLARRLLALDRPDDPDRAELIERARARLRRRAEASQWRDLRADGSVDRLLDDDEEVAAVLRRAAVEALDALLDERRGVRG